jgi:hypothetical protein
MAISWFLRFLFHIHEDLLLLFSITPMASWEITETTAVAHRYVSDTAIAPKD